MKQGKIYVVGIGPGNIEHLTVKAKNVLGECEVVIGYKTYIDLIYSLIKDKEIISSGMRKEVERSETAFENALNGRRVAVVSSGDAGIYGMAGIIFEVVKKNNSKIDVEIIPGVSSVNVSAALLGAPLMHDFACISLSDLLTDWRVIKKRLINAGKADFVITIYNPKSKTRTEEIKKAQKIFLKYKNKKTPVGIVKNAAREGESVIITTLDKMLEHDIDMSTTIIIGNSSTFIFDGRIITPRGYKL